MRRCVLHDEQNRAAPLAADAEPLDDSEQEEQAGAWEPTGISRSKICPHSAHRNS